MRWERRERPRGQTRTAEWRPCHGRLLPTCPQTFRSTIPGFSAAGNWTPGKPNPEKGAPRNPGGNGPICESAGTAFTRALPAGSQRGHRGPVAVVVSTPKTSAARSSRVGVAAHATREHWGQGREAQKLAPRGNGVKESSDTGLVF